LARADEVERLVEMGERFHRESVYKEHVTHNHEQMIALATKLVADGNILVMEFNGALVGMIGLVFFPHYLSGERVAVEVFWWLEPEHRGEGRKLLKAAEDFARERGAMKCR
jgi:RimJ/RimL family protein N-acetyltransferase